MRSNSALALVGQSFLVIFALSSSISARAQDFEPSVADTVLVTIVDGSDILGVVADLTAESITIRTAMGIVVTIPRENIVSIKNAANRKFRNADPNTSRLFFGPTARALGSGGGYFAVYEVLFPFVGIGIGSKLNLAGGMTLVPGAPYQFIYAAPKLTIVESKISSTAVGLLAMKITSDEDTWGMVYGVSTFGPPERSITVGLATGFYNGEFGKNPIIMLGGETRVSEKVKLITENYIVAGGYNILTGGIRIMGRRMSTDLAFVTSTSFLSEGGFPLIPWVGFAYNFTR